MEPPTTGRRREQTVLTRRFFTLLNFAMAAVVLAGILGPGAPVHAETPSLERPPAPSGEAVVETGRVIVQFRPGVDGADRAALHAALGAQVMSRIPTLSIEVVELPNAAATRGLARAYAKNPMVTFAEPDALMPLADSPPTVPDDEFYDPTQYQWQHPAIDTPEAWSTTTGSGTNRITVCDTGVSAGHEDLAGNLNTSLGWNTVDDTNDFSPVHWHGTFVAGMAAAIGNNGAGVAGAAWDAEIVPVRVSNRSDGAAFTSDMAECIIYGTSVSSVAINLSYQTYSSGTISPTIIAAADLANAGGSLLVVAAGNENTNPATNGDTDPQNILYVASTDEGDVKSSFSNFGPYVDLAAPGGDVVSTYVVCTTTGPPRNRGCNTEVSSYAWASGTSFSAPLTAGVALLVRAAGAGATPAALRAALTNGACDLGDSGEDDIFGAGLLNAHHAIHGESCGAGSGPTEHWALDDGADVTAVDSSGNGHDGTLVNGPSWGTGRLAGGLSFDGNDDRVDLPAAAVDGLSDVTATL